MASQGIGQALKGAPPPTPSAAVVAKEEQEPDKLILANKAGESKSPYVRAHASNPVAWQLWGDDAIALARKENKLLFVSIGYSACHCKSSSLHAIQKK